jgi:hypothetical protein
MLGAVVLFAIAALGGVFLASRRLQRKELPLGVALVHGAFAAAGLVALFLAIHAASGAGNAKLALGIFVVAALGGFLLFSFHLRKKELPIAVVAIHGAVAVAAFVILLAAYLS